LARRLPGTGTAATRLAAYDARFFVPEDRLAVVFERALEECRQRTRAQLDLPDGERVTVTYVTGRPWSGFSRFMGGGHSLIEINTGFSLTVDRVLDLACHEGYPGHHAFSTLREQSLPADWVEGQVTPLFSPDAFVAEAAASMASEMVFTGPERLAFERDVLFPLAGLPVEAAAEYLDVVALTSELRAPLGRVIAGYLAGELDVIEASWALQADALMAQPLATLQFVNRYRGYALAYTAGRARLETQLGHDLPAAERWINYRRLAEGRELLR
jgi:hypothetical protein